jgi:hypothetical protein
MATTEQMLHALVEQVGRLTTAMAAGGGVGTPVPEERPRTTTGHKRHIYAKDIRCSEFSGKQEDWSEWSFSFKRAVRAQSIPAFDLLEAYEKSAMPLWVQDPERDELAAELYDILAMLCKGEAILMIKAEEEFNGVKVWCKMFQRYNPRTLGRMVKMLGEVTAPPRVTKMGEIESAISKWEQKARVMEREFDQKFHDALKMAIVINMVPNDIQEFVYGSMEKDSTYDAIVTKIKLLAGNKMAMTRGGPVPMDVGLVGEHGDGAEGCDGDHRYLGSNCNYGSEWGEADVDAVGFHTQCYGCGGWGHTKRDCPSVAGGKGKGGGAPGGGKGDPKGGKGGMKGGFAGGAKGWYGGGYGGGAKGGYGGGIKGGKGEGGKGAGGKGYQGTCYNCGKVGHKKAECRSPTMAQAVDEDHDESGVWWIGEIEFGPTVIDTVAAIPPAGASTTCLTSSLSDAGAPRTEGGTSITTSSKTSRKRTSEFNVATKNMYQVLAETEEEEVDIMAIDAKAKKLTRLSAMKFNEADVKKPLASAVNVARAGNRIVVDDQGGYIENKSTGERMEVRIERNTYVYDVQLEDGDEVTVTLDSGAGCNVWPRGKRAADSKLLPKQPGMSMKAANGTEITYYGQRVIRFRGMEEEEKGEETLGFTRPM